ncbi:MAG TPA: radical SAM protein [Ignavibacteriales bacterium]|nr:radical SAM protein [Ignavibacteriales bacterium]
MLTSRCNRKCEYCITRNIRVDSKGIEYAQIRRLYSDLSLEHKEIMLTGGEPTLAPFLSIAVVTAKDFFEKVFITTQNPILLKPKHLGGMFNAITFSMHDKAALKEKVENGATVYASILDKFYKQDLPEKLKAQGFSGLTINEEQREGKEFTQKLPEIEGFSIKVNRKGKCMDETIILPDLRVITDFREFL